MSWIGRLFGIADGSVVIADELHPPYPSVEDAIAAYVAERSAGGPLVLPAVERGVELIASAVAQLTPVVYRDGMPLQSTPRIVDRPDPWTTRYRFLFETVRSMVETGDAYWFLFDPDPETSRPRAARVLPSSEVTIRWDGRRFLPVYEWRGKPMTLGVDLVHLPLAPRVGELHGVSPLVACESALEAITFAELYAAGWFAGSGIPSGTITSPVELSDGEADKLKAAWLKAHAGPIPTPAVLSGGVAWEAEARSPVDSQLDTTREHGVATVARLLGIPAPLLLVSTAGTSITYANVSQLWAEAYRDTIGPLYLNPIEAAWSDLVARSSVVRFDLGELGRLDVASRWSVYEVASRLGVLDAAAIARQEGLDPQLVPAQLDPSPAPPAATVPEVPA